MGDLAALQHMALFVAVARAGSFSRASATLGVPQATLSRRIAVLEREFRVRLFDRTTRRVELTNAGRRYFERCAHLVDEARLAEEALRESATQPSGHVRVSMPVDLGVHFIGPLLPEFARQYPGVSFELDLSPRRSDLIGEHIDVAIRIGAVKGEHLVARRIGSSAQRLFASPAYLDLRGRPQQPADLVEHDCIFVTNAQGQASWRLVRESATIEVEVRGRFSVNNVGLMRVLAERGMGIAALDPALARDSVVAARLAWVLPEWALPPLPIHAVTSSRLQPAAVRAFVEFLATQLALR